MRILPHQIYLMNLRQAFPEDHEMYMGREIVLQLLQDKTGQNFGFDAYAWKQWFKENKNWYRKDLNEES